MANGYLTRHGGLSVCFVVVVVVAVVGLEVDEAQNSVKEKLGQLTRGEWGPFGLVLLSDCCMYYTIIQVTSDTWFYLALLEIYSYYYDYCRVSNIDLNLLYLAKKKV